ncbi:MAG: MFS transporter [Propionibacteriaceae bacterium]|nr:MFS transporter [Propionibacteriaceae bacterium]
MVILDTTVLNVALPGIATATGASSTQQQWIIDSYVLTMTALLMAGGGLIDRFGASRVFRSGIVVFTVASVAGAACTTAVPLIAARAVQGVGGAFLIPAALAVVAQEFPDQAQRGKIIAVVATITASPQAFGPTLGGFLVDTLGWRSVFLLNLPIGVLAMIFARRIQHSVARSRPLDYPGIVLLIVSLGGLTYGLIQFTQGGWPLSNLLAAVAVAGVAAVVFVVIEKRVRQPLLPSEVRRSPTVMLYALAGLTIFIVFYGALFAANLYFQKVLGFGAFTTGLLLIAGGFPVFALPIIVSKVGHKLHPWALTLAGAVVCTLGTLFGVFATTGHSTEWVVACLLVVGVGFGILTAPHLTLAMSVSPRGATGVVSALANSGRQSGYLIGVALVGTAGIDLAGYHRAIMVAAAAGLVTLVVLIIARPRAVVPVQT